MFVNANGYIEGLFDEKWRVKPECYSPRRATAVRFRTLATGRILLGEFDMLAKQDTARRPFGRSHSGWWAMLPSDRKTLAHLFLSDATFDEIRHFLTTVPLHAAISATSKPEAFAKALQSLTREVVNDHSHYEWHRTEYDPIDWRAL
jgi:hypothetical protein